MMSGNLAAARSATARLPGYHTIYRTDLRATTERSDAQSPEISTAFWNLAVAFVALESGMPYLCSDISQSVSLLQPRLSMAHSLRVAALFGANGNLEESYDAIKKSVPNTGLAMYMEARDLAKNGKTDEANKVAAELLKREPDNDHIRYQMAQLNLLMDQIDLAITRLEALWSVPGPFQGAAGNDLAYLLCEHKPDRLDEAYLIAGKVLQHAPTSPPLQDTVGWIEFHRGNRNVAMKHINRAVVKLNFLSEVHYHLGAVYHSFKNARWARYHLERAVEGPVDKDHVKKAKKLLEQL
jgi:predicted Zn-dependent protease